MENLKATFINEAYKMLRRKKVTVIVIFSLLLVAFTQIAVLVIKNEAGIVTAGSIEFSLLVLSVFSVTVLPLFSVLTAIDLFSGEIGTNTLKLVVTMPVSRIRIFSAKLLALAGFILFALLSVLLFSIISGLIFNKPEFEPIGLIRLLTAFIVTLLPVFVFSLIAVLLSNVLKSGTGVFFVCMLIYLVFIVAGTLFGGISGFLITSLFDWYKLFIADYFPFIKILKELILMTGFGVMLYTLGLYFFDKREL